MPPCAKLRALLEALRRVEVYLRNLGPRRPGLRWRVRTCATQAESTLASAHAKLTCFTTQMRWSYRVSPAVGLQRALGDASRAEQLHASR
jgi:hypothetical protein